jgi:hypothetical protein
MGRWLGKKGVKQKSAKKAGKAPKKKTETKPDAKKKTE